VLKLPEDGLTVFQGTVAQRVAVHIQAIEDHVAQIAGELPVAGSQPGL
jgi:hypothetical protein